MRSLHTTPVVCLVTPGHVASTPRLVKEADALCERGFGVHVVAGRHFSPVDPLDADIFAAAKWQYTLVDYRRSAATRFRGVLRLLSRLALARMPLTSIRIAARAHHAETLRLAAAASRIPAQLYVGHCLAGLPAVAIAARAHRRPYGFDAEDFHGSETDAALTERAEISAARILQAKLLPGCAHLTAASPLIARRYAERYGVEPRVVLNVFPITQAPPEPVDPGPISDKRPARAYWFSQTIGPGRGLEAVVAILGHMRTPVELQLRGFAAPEYVRHLNQHAARMGLARPIRFLSSAPAAEMARLAAHADMGLSTEESHPPNRDLCLTNKIFIYLLAGIPQLLSPTSAQTEIAPSLGDAVLLRDLSRVVETARDLDVFLADSGRVASARRSARTLARERYCWDLEKEIFLSSIRNALPQARMA